METKNTYKYPVNLSGGNIEMTYDRSPVHKGPLKYAVDLICPKGTEVLAAGPGVVRAIKDDSDVGGSDISYYDDGNYIVIEHSNGEYSSYEHLLYNGVLVKVGQEVKTGQHIGHSGATGYLATLPPHLHFVISNKADEYDKDFISLKIRWEAE